MVLAFTWPTLLLKRLLFLSLQLESIVNDSGTYHLNIQEDFSFPTFLISPERETNIVRPKESKSERHGRPFYIQSCLEFKHAVFLHLL